MPLVSSPEFIRQGKPSLLAVVETVVATGASLCLAWWTGSIAHLIVASIIAPFLLLRTPLSSRFAEYLILERFSAWAGDRDVREAIWVFMIFPLKVYAALRCLIRHPLDALENLPKNYSRNTFMLDLSISPALIPGSEAYWKKNEGNLAATNRVDYVSQLDAQQRSERDEVRGLPIYYLLSKYRRLLRDGTLTIWTVASAGPVMIFILILSISYRYAIKSTALFWLPLIWIVRNTRVPSQPYEQIRADLRDPLNKVVLAVSSCTAALFIGKVFVLFRAVTLPQLEWMGPIGILITQLAAPLELPLWQVASAANAMIAWAFYFHGHRLLLTRDLPNAWSETRVQREYAAMRTVRTTLSVYAIICALWIAAVTAWGIDWPVIHVIVFPWSK